MSLFSCPHPRNRVRCPKNTDTSTKIGLFCGRCPKNRDTSHTCQNNATPALATNSFTHSTLHTIPRSKIERGIYYNSITVNHLVAKAKAIFTAKDSAAGHGRRSWHGSEARKGTQSLPREPQSGRPASRRTPRKARYPLRDRNQSRIPWPMPSPADTHKA